MAGEGLSANGFTKKTLTVIIAELNAAAQALFGPQVNLLPSSNLSQFISIFASREAAIWDLLQQTYNSLDPDQALGAQMDLVAGLTGIRRLPAKSSRSTVQYFFGTVGTTIGTTFQVAVNNNAAAIFQLDAPVTLVAGTNEVQTLSFGATPASGSFVVNLENLATGALAWNVSAGQVQTAVQALTGYAGVTVTGSVAAGFVFTYGGAAGLQPQPLLTISSNSLLTAGSAAVTTSVVHTTPGVPQAQGTMTCTQTGPIAAPEGTLTQILTPVTGITSTINDADATAGQNVELTSALRLRRAAQLQSTGTSTVEALRSKLLALSGVTQCVIFENVGLTTDGNGLPGKSFEAFVQGGTNADIAACIWANKPAGIQTYGSSSADIVDSQGLTHTMNFSRPTLVPIYFIVNITRNSSYPANGDAQVIAALLAYGAAIQQGVNVRVSSDVVPAICDAVAGIESIAVLAGTAPAPGSSANIAIAIQQLAQVLSANITVNS